jgi:hypothetical protein
MTGSYNNQFICTDRYGQSDTCFEVSKGNKGLPALYAYRGNLPMEATLPNQMLNRFKGRESTVIEILHTAWHPCDEVAVSTGEVTCSFY